MKNENETNALFVVFVDSEAAAVVVVDVAVVVVVVVVDVVADVVVDVVVVVVVVAMTTFYFGVASIKTFSKLSSSGILKLSFNLVKS